MTGPAVCLSEPPCIGRCSAAARAGSAVAALPGGEAFRDEVRAIKLRCQDTQDSLLERFAAKARERGATVFLAADAAAAIRYVSSGGSLRGKDGGQVEIAHQRGDRDQRAPGGGPHGGDETDSAS